MATEARFAHVNLIAHDWERLAAFYERAFGCVRLPPERDLEGAWLDRATGLRRAHIRGAHLRLPGRGSDGPTLEIFQYEPQASSTFKAPNRPGWGHIAFVVDDVRAARDAVLAAGGSAVGDVVSVEIAGAGSIAFAYVADPEGNIIEIQQWTRKT